MNSSKNKRVSTASTFLKVVATINGSALVIFLIPGVMESLGRSGTLFLFLERVAASIGHLWEYHALDFLTRY